MAFSIGTTKAKALGALFAAALALVALAGCSGQSAETAQQNENRQYMSQVNQVMDDLDNALASFTDAVSRNDVVGMQTQAQNALATLDDLGSIEAPEDLADVQQSYQDGCNQLREALNDYVALYTEISSATDDQPFDWSTYDSRLADIQQKYDAGIEKMKEGDATAASKEGGTPQTDAASQDGQQAADQGSQDDASDQQAADDGQASDGQAAQDGSDQASDGAAA